MGKITYADKETLYTNNDIPANQKVQSSDMNEIKKVVNENDDLLQTVSNVSIEEAKLEPNSGYIKYKNGLIIQWKTLTELAGGTQWGNVYYSDHEMGDWDIPFTTLLTTWSNIETPQEWCSNGNQTTTSAGLVRAFRPNAGTISAKISIVGLGVWK